MTESEKIFWGKVRAKQFMGYKFLRQHPVFYNYNNRLKFFIADFYCRELKIIIEIDGGIHEQQKDYDLIRSEILENQHDLKIIRYTNREVNINVQKVLIDLRKNIIKPDLSAPADIN